MLKWSKRFLILLWCLGMIVLGMWLVADNKAVISVSYFGLQLENQTVGLLMCQMLCIGALLGYLTSVITAQGRIYIHRRRYKKASKEIEQLKSAQQKG